MQQDISGFHAKRCEFDHEYDNDAELLISEIDFLPTDTPVSLLASMRHCRREGHPYENARAKDTAIWPLLSCVISFLLLQPDIEKVDCSSGIENTSHTSKSNFRLSVSDMPLHRRIWILNM